MSWLRRSTSQTWLFGGRVVNVPCSHMAHLERQGLRDYRSGPSWYPHTMKNFRRAIELWGGPYNDTFFQFLSDMKASLTDTLWPDNDSRSGADDAMTSRRYDVTTLRRYDVTTLRRYDVTTLRRYDVTTLRRYDVTTLRRYDVTTSRRHDVTTLRRYDVTTLRRYDVTTLRRYDVTTLYPR